MAQVLAIPAQLDGYYRSSSPRCHSPQPSFRASSIPYEKTVPRSHDVYSSPPPRKPSPPSSSVSSSPELSSVACSTQSSASSSVTSSICLDDSPSNHELENSEFFPVYDFAATCPSPSISPLPNLIGYPQSADEEVDIEFSDRDSTPTPTKFTPSYLRLQPADDTFVSHEPSRHVDYLSHDWKEEDIWASWRYMVGKRKVHGNSIRLENASWRTWGKKKFKLRTMSAGKLNWLKDCDVTWLYGPLSIGASRLSGFSPQSPVASPVEPKLQSSGSFFKTKPILKRRSMSEVMLQKSLSNSSLLKQATAAIESQQSNSTLCQSRPSITGRSNSDFSSFSQSPRSSCIQTSDLPSTVSSGCRSPSAAKHIHFNDRVQQCIAVETDDDDDDDFYSRKYDADYSSSDDGIIMMAKMKSCTNKTTERSSSFSEPQTIAHLPSTSLKVKDEVPIKTTTGTTGSFMSLNAIFSSTKPAPTLKSTFTGTKSYVLEDDEDSADLEWEPHNSSFAARKSSFAVAKPKICDGNTSVSENNSDEDDFQLPNFDSWEDEDPAAGLFGRAVDAVNTARDIAHVLWNVGWRR